MASELFDKSDHMETNDQRPVRGPSKVSEMKGYFCGIKML